MKFEQGGRFYDWPKTFSYGARFTLVVGARDIGKTFGLRYHLLKDYLRNGNRFAEVFRHTAGAKLAAPDYFGKLALLGEFDGLQFRSDTRGGYVREASKKKGGWEQVCYFPTLTTAQGRKGATYVNVRSVFMDEFILDSTNHHTRYLPGEFAKFAGIVDTMTRENSGDDRAMTRAFLLGNSLDLVNPYFAAFGIDEPPAPGFHWYAGKRALLHMVERSEQAARERQDETLAGILLSLAGDQAELDMALKNEFANPAAGFVKPRTKVSRPVLSLIWRGTPLTLWTTKNNGGGYHVRAGISRECEQARSVYYFHKRDAQIDYRAAKRAEKSITWVLDAFKVGRITFETPALFEQFAQVATYLGLPL